MLINIMKQIDSNNIIYFSIPIAITYIVLRLVNPIYRLLADMIL
jgi:hypothetical protein